VIVPVFNLTMNARTLLFIGLVVLLVVSALLMIVMRQRRPRPAPDNATFSVLQGNVDGHPLIAMIDMGLRTSSNMQLLPFYVSVSTPLVNPTSDGLPTKDDANDLNSWEETIESNLASAGKLGFLGRVTWNGRRELLYYVGTEQPAVQVLNTLVDAHSTRPFTFTYERDEKWAKADRWLRP
jgi:Family of unknown function (DUF695)